MVRPIPQEQEPIVPHEFPMSGDLFSYIAALVRRAPGTIHFSTGAGRIFQDLLIHWPTLDCWENEAQELCQRITDAVFPLAGSLFAQAVEIEATISPTPIAPPARIEALATEICFDLNQRSERTCFLSPHQPLPALDRLGVDSGIVVLCRPLNYRYHTVKDDRKRRGHPHAGLFELSQRLINELYEKPPFIRHEHIILDKLKAELHALAQRVEMEEAAKLAATTATVTLAQISTPTTPEVNLAIPAAVRNLNRRIMAYATDKNLSSELRMGLRQVARSLLGTYPQAIIKEAAYFETMPPSFRTNPLFVRLPLDENRTPAKAGAPSFVPVRVAAKSIAVSPSVALVAPITVRALAVTSPRTVTQQPPVAPRTEVLRLPLALVAAATPPSSPSSTPARTVPLVATRQNDQRATARLVVVPDASPLETTILFSSFSQDALPQQNLTLPRTTVRSETTSVTTPQETRAPSAARQEPSSPQVSAQPETPAQTVTEQRTTARVETTPTTTPQETAAPSVSRQAPSSPQASAQQEEPAQILTERRTTARVETTPTTTPQETTAQQRSTSSAPTVEEQAIALNAVPSIPAPAQPTPKQPKPVAGQPTKPDASSRFVADQAVTTREAVTLPKSIIAQEPLPPLSPPLAKAEAKPQPLLDIKERAPISSPPPQQYASVEKVHYMPHHVEDLDIRPKDFYRNLKTTPPEVIRKVIPTSSVGLLGKEATFKFDEEELARRARLRSRLWAGFPTPSPAPAPRTPIFKGRK